LAILDRPLVDDNDDRYAPTVERIFASVKVPDAPPKGPPISWLASPRVATNVALADDSHRSTTTIRIGLFIPTTCAEFCGIVPQTF
jgi:hypothetical protein